MTEVHEKEKAEELDLEQFGAKKKLKKGVIVLAAIIGIVAGISAIRTGYSALTFYKALSGYEKAVIIAMKDPQDPSKQCKCLTVTEGRGGLSAKLGASASSSGDTKECGHDIMITYLKGTEEFNVTISTLCQYMNYRGEGIALKGEKRGYSEFFLAGIITKAKTEGEECDCADPRWD